MPTHESFVHPFRLPHRGEERAHFNFCCTFAQQKTERPRGVVLSLSESLTEFRVRRRERCLIRFLPRPVRGRKHFARSERRIVRCQRTTEAQSAANLSRKSGFATFSTASEHTVWCAPRLSRNYSFADKQERTVGRSKVVRKFPYGNFLPLKASKPQQKTAPKGG